MKKWLCILMGFCLIPILVQAKHHAAKETQNWPHLRGPNANGLVDKGNPPVEWSEDTNIRWKVKIPGTGHATPIVWGDKIFVQTAVKTDQTVEVAQTGRKKLPTHIYQFKLLALDRKSGDVVWEKTVREALPHEGTHKTANYAATSGVTDGEHLYAFYGSWGLYCFDFDGNLKWDKDFGDMRVAGTFGEGSSPTIHGNTLIINWDHQGASFIVALDKRTGEEIWRTARPERTTWTTPIVVEHKGTQQIIVGASGKTRVTISKLVMCYGNARDWGQMSFPPPSMPMASFMLQVVIETLPCWRFHSIKPKAILRVQMPCCGLLLATSLLMFPRPFFPGTISIA